MNELASRLRAQPEGDLSLAVAAVALGVGTGVAYSRMVDSWGNFPLFLLVAVPCAVVFGLALAPGSGGNPVGAAPDGRLVPWQTTCLLVAIPLLAGSILLLIRLLGKQHPGTGTATWVLLLSGVIAALISVRFDSPGAILLAALTLGIAGVTAVSWLDSGAAISAYRDVLLAEGLVFLVLARSLWQARHAQAKQLVAVAGIGLISGAAAGSGPGTFGLVVVDQSIHSKDGWTFIVIAVSIGILAFAAWQRHGGSAFVGLFGVYQFALLTSSGGDLSGWPLVLGATALVCLIWALLVRPSRQSPGAGPAAAPQPPPT
jgi:hypothetical protein